MSGIETGFNLLWNSITNVRLFGIGGELIFPLGLVMILSLMISPKKFSNAKVTALPLMVGLKGLGVNIPVLFLALAGIIFVVDIMSISSIGGLIGAISSGLSDTVNVFGKEGKYRREKREVNRERMYEQWAGEKELRKDTLSPVEMIKLAKMKGQIGKAENKLKGTGLGIRTVANKEKTVEDLMRENELEIARKKRLNDLFKMGKGKSYTREPIRMPENATSLRRLGKKYRFKEKSNKKMWDMMGE